jgi:hypothetical protein
MILAGLVLLLGSLAGGYFSLRAGDIVALGLECFLGVLGGLAVGHGARSLMHQGRV